jgi:hypothetical protein
MLFRKSANSYLKILLGVLFIAVIFGYTYFQSEDFARGPEFTYLSPEGGTIFEDSLIEVKGQVLRVSKITLNGNPIFTDEEGNFSEAILLSIGQNIITLEAQDRFERKVTETLELIYK